MAKMSARPSVDLTPEKPIDPWAHRSDNMRCKTCMWFVPKVAAERDAYDLGRCRRHAPDIGGYPVVMVNDWCGDHRLDENKYLRQ
jgi:hypothetical protein